MMTLLTEIAAAGTKFVLLRPADSSPAPTLLLFALSGVETLTCEPYCLVGRLLHAQGWAVVSLDLPCHGADRRPGEPEMLAGWAARVGKGEDIAADFRGRVHDIIDYLVTTGVADPQRIAAAGTSRGGYMAFQAAAGDARIRAVAALSPVTDLLALSEFADQEQNTLADGLALVYAADRLDECAAWITIGNADQRVDTDRAIGFARVLTRVSQTKQVTLRVLPTHGHASRPAWHETAAQWLAETCG